MYVIFQIWKSKVQIGLLRLKSYRKAGSLLEAGGEDLPPGLSFQRLLMLLVQPCSAAAMVFFRPTSVCPSVLRFFLLEENLVLTLGPWVIQCLRSLQTLADERTLNPSGSLLPCVRQGNRYSAVRGIRTLVRRSAVSCSFNDWSGTSSYITELEIQVGQGGRSEIGFWKDIKCLQVKGNNPCARDIPFKISDCLRQENKSLEKLGGKEIREGAHCFLDLPASSPGAQEGTLDSKKLKIWGKGSLSWCNLEREHAIPVWSSCWPVVGVSTSLATSYELRNLGVDVESWAVCARCWNGGSGA